MRESNEDVGQHSKWWSGMNNGMSKSWLMQDGSDPKNTRYSIVDGAPWSFVFECKESSLPQVNHPSLLRHPCTYYLSLSHTRTHTNQEALDVVYLFSPRSMLLHHPRTPHLAPAYLVCPTSHAHTPTRRHWTRCTSSHHTRCSTSGAPWSQPPPWSRGSIPSTQGGGRSWACGRRGWCLPPVMTTTTMVATTAAVMMGASAAVTKTTRRASS